jgi:hypothetical protein
VSDDGLRALAGLTALWERVLDDGLRVLAGLTDLDLSFCVEVSDDGLRALASLTALTRIKLIYNTRCTLVVTNENNNTNRLADLPSLGIGL